MFAPESVQVPVPVLASEVAPVPLSHSAGDRVALPVPARVSVRAVFAPASATEPKFVKVRGAWESPEASSVPPLMPKVKSRSVSLLEDLPTKRSVPPLSTKFEAALLDLPMLLLDPPLPCEPTANTPPITVVGPV